MIEGGEAGAAIGAVEIEGDAGGDLFDLRIRSRVLAALGTAIQPTVESAWMGTTIARSTGIHFRT